LVAVKCGLTESREYIIPHRLLERSAQYWEDDKSLQRARPMADKRNSVAGKVATPNLKAGGGSTKDVADADANLYKAVGSRYASPCNDILDDAMVAHMRITD
jgi:hypothetical protein